MVKTSIKSANMTTNIQGSIALSEKLTSQGEMALLCGDFSGLKFFEMADNLDETNPHLFYKQGLALFDYGCADMRDIAFKEANKRFRKAVSLDPYSFDAYVAWAHCLYCLGERKNSAQILANAKNKYKKALSLAQGKGADELSDLYWNYGKVWLKLAENSGEAIDLNLALKAFEKTLSYQEDLPSEFWKTYGIAALNLGEKTNELGHYTTAIDCFKNAISMGISSGFSWFDLAKALVALYSHTFDEAHFSAANESFTNASNFTPGNATISLAWAKFLVNSGRFLKDRKRLLLGVEQCQKAVSFDPGNDEIASVWAEALATLGMLTEDLKLIFEAQNKLSERDLVDLQPYARGICLHALGSYFNDLDYYYQAIEAFQSGLNTTRTEHRLWFELGSTYMVIASLENDPRIYEKASRFFQKALNFKLSSIYHISYASALAKYGAETSAALPLKQSIHHFEQALHLQKNAVYLFPDWMFAYACSLDSLANISDEEEYYVKSLEILNHVLMVDPDFPDIHRELALVNGHYAEFVHEPDLFYRSFHHFKIAQNRQKENDQVMLDWALTLINFSQVIQGSHEALECLKEAEYKMVQAAKLGNSHSYYHLACLYSLTETYDKAIHFLQKALSFNAMPAINEIMQDDWLENLRKHEVFEQFIVRAKEDMS
ncbi:MAG: hypothetical protein SP1CHLAM54_05040 [Chlamydiia bacterium]|nr:hypothetical protein [Chlamydiia bacterium]MCH9615416.1 hypothetical protein [Chlamydiia bacterium]MCH9628262.1 hypothetical protein [Chlamydiia bacterium]